MAERRSDANNNGNTATLEPFDNDLDDGRGRGWHGNPEGHAEAGRKGGQTVSQNRAHMAAIGRKGGQSVSQNRNHMAEIGRRGGQSRGGGKSDDADNNSSQNGRSISGRRRTAQANN